MDRTQKEAVVKAFREDLSRADSVILVEYRGLTVPEATELRSRFRDADVTYKVVKNTLAKRAISGTDKSVLSDALIGPTAWIYAHDDPVTPAKVLAEFMKDRGEEHLSLKGGFLQGKLLSPAQVKELSTLPGRDELRAKVLCLLTATATKLVRVLAARPVEFLQVLRARQDELDKA